MILAAAEFWNVHWLWFALPLALAVAVVYKATKIDRVVPLILHSLKLFAYIVVGMAAVGLFLWWLAEALPPPRLSL